MTADPDHGLTHPESWVDEHGDVLFRFALLRVRNRSLAEALVQEALLAAFRSRRRYSGRASERTWLVQILRNKIVDHFRRRSREVPVSELAADPGQEERLYDERGHWREGPAPWSPDPKYKTGEPMDAFDDDGLRQQVVLQAAQALVFTCINRTDLALLEKGLAVKLTIAVCGRANTIDGEGAITSSGATTAPYSRFVPGGNPAGGHLPPAPAAPLNSMLENHWRKGNGEDFFVAPLRKGQKAGSKRAAKNKDHPLRKDKTAHFELEASGKKHLVTAPFLGELAKQQQYPPPDFLNDYREFNRSYQTCFLHWLSQHGSKESAEQSEEMFRELVLRMGSRETLVLDAVAEQVYGVPLSGTDPSTESLEWRFLAWLQSGGK